MVPALTQRDRLLTLAGILLALFLGALDQTIVATALPRIALDLHGVARYTWVATAYLVTSTVFLPLIGKLADSYSRRTIEVAAVFLFLLGSGLCGLAGEFGSVPILGDGMNQLIVFRALQGVGGAGLFSLTFVLIADLFPPAERGRYQGLVGAVFGLTSVLGPFLGGLLTDSGTDWLPGIAGWRLVFYVNLPLGMVALWLITTRMPALRPAARPSPIDYSTASLLVGGLLPLVLALQLDKTSYGWGSPLTLGLLGCAIALLTWFVHRSRQSTNPVLDLHLFRNPVFLTANGAQFLLGGVFLAVILFEPLFMVRVSGVSATRAGVSLVPLSLGIALSSMLSGKLLASGRGTIRAWLLAGGGILLVGVALLATMPPNIGYLSILGYILLCGLGFGPGFPLYPLAIQNAVEPRQIGQATSASQFFRQLGGVVAAAVLGSLFNSRLLSVAPTPLAYAAAIGTVYRWALGLAGAGVLVTLLMPVAPFRHSTQTP